MLFHHGDPHMVEDVFGMNIEAIMDSSIGETLEAYFADEVHAQYLRDHARAPHYLELTREARRDRRRLKEQLARAVHRARSLERIVHKQKIMQGHEGQVAASKQAAKGKRRLLLQLYSDT